MLFFAFVHWNFHQRKLFKVINKTFINESYLKLLLTILVKDCDLKSTFYAISSMKLLTSRTIITETFLFILQKQMLKL